MLQEKAQDRERLLLKFIKIMKVALAPSWACFWRPCPRAVGEPSLPTSSSLPLHLSLQHLRKLNNFNSYLAILSALDSAPIRRLEWQKQTSEVRVGKGVLRAGMGSWTRALAPQPPALWPGQPTPACLRLPPPVSVPGSRGFVIGAGGLHHSILLPAPQRVASRRYLPLPSLAHPSGKPALGWGSVRRWGLCCKEADVV